MPFALNVLRTGASMWVAKARISSPKARAPLPQMITGRSACPRSSTARDNSSSGGAIAAAATRPTCGRATGSTTPGSSCTSSGKMRWATSRLMIACFMASAASSVAFSGRSTVWLHSATAENADELVHERYALLGDGQLDIEAVSTLLHGVWRGRILEPGRRLSGRGVVLVGVPRTDEIAVGELAVAEGTALVRAVVVEGAVAG